jgi:hypothetical protein
VVETRTDNRVCELLFLSSVAIEIKTFGYLNWGRHC